jgi:hypothetical protein
MKKWVSRLAFVASLFALFATSPARWEIAATVVGPTAPTHGRALSLEITASQAPQVEMMRLGATTRELVPCLSAFAPGAPTTCLLPPDASIAQVEISGGCSGGLSCSAPPCIPPPTASLVAKSTETDVSLDTASMALTTTLPVHRSSGDRTYFNVVASGAEYIEVQLVVRPHGGGAAIHKTDLNTCNTSCSFDIADTVVASSRSGTGSFDVEAQASGYKACAAAPCASPGTLKVDRIEISK